jgi:hypothetical protein
MARAFRGSVLLLGCHAAPEIHESVVRATPSHLELASTVVLRTGSVKAGYAGRCGGMANRVWGTPAPIAAGTKQLTL